MLFQIMMTDGLTRAVATAVGNRGTVAEETDRTGVTMEAGVVDTATEDIRTEVHSDHKNMLPSDRFYSYFYFSMSQSCFIRLYLIDAMINSSLQKLYLVL